MRLIMMSRPSQPSAKRQPRSGKGVKISLKGEYASKGSKSSKSEALAAISTYESPVQAATQELSQANTRHPKSTPDVGFTSHADELERTQAELSEVKAQLAAEVQRREEVWILLSLVRCSE